MMLKNRGFTLLEVLIAAAILGGGLIASFYMFPLGLRQLRISRILMDISFFAKKKLGEIKTYNYIEDSSGQEQNLNWNVTVHQIEPIPDIKLRKVILAVSYNHEGMLLNEEFVTYFSPEEEAHE